MPSNHLIFCHLLLLLPSFFPSIRVFYNELALRIRWPKYWSFSFSSVQFSSVVQSCPTLCDPMNCSMPGLPVHHHLPELRSLQRLFGRFEKKKKKSPALTFSHLLCHYQNIHQVIPSLTMINFPLASLTAKIRILGGGWDGG